MGSSNWKDHFLILNLSGRRGSSLFPWIRLFIHKINHLKSRTNSRCRCWIRKNRLQSWFIHHLLKSNWAIINSVVEALKNLWLHNHLSHKIKEKRFNMIKLSSLAKLMNKKNIGIRFKIRHFLWQGCNKKMEIPRLKP